MKNPYTKIIIWGLRDRYHTHRYIHQAFYETGKRLGWNILWVEDERSNAHLIEAGDLVISSQVGGKMIPEKKVFGDYALPIKDGVFYCLHNFNTMFTEKVDRKHLLILQVYTHPVEIGTEKLDTVRFFDRAKQTLYQPWGTHLLPEEFKKPTFSRSPFVFWIGSIWDNEYHQGNKKIIEELKQTLKKHGLIFSQMRFIPDWLNVFLIRHSRLAPAIAGAFQAETQYLPCRMFKNISFGQLGFSNVSKFKDILGEAILPGETIEEMATTALALSPKDYKKLVMAQQEKIKKYTYKDSYEYIFKALEMIPK